jgi:DNA-binding response OmpR family regulator
MQPEHKLLVDSRGRLPGDRPDRPAFPAAKGAMHALVIEDDANVAFYIECIFRDAGFRTVEIAVTAAQAVRSAQLNRPAFITADVNLIGSNGIDAVDEIRSFCPAPFVFITSAYHEVRDRMPGACLLMKPFQAHELESLIGRHLPR